MGVCMRTCVAFNLKNIRLRKYVESCMQRWIYRGIPQMIVYVNVAATVIMDLSM